MESIENRHSGTAGGVLVTSDQSKPLNVHVSVSPYASGTVAGQRALWMLVNLLVRAVGAVASLTVTCPENKLLPGVSPGHAVGSSLLPAVLKPAQLINGVSVAPAAQAPERSFVIGIGGVDDAQLYLIFGDWWGGITSTAGEDSGAILPFGPYIAAAHAAGQVFRASRGRTEFDPFFYDSWQHATTHEIPKDPPPLGASLKSNFLLAGVGAVGTAALLALWATPGLEGTVHIADGDTVDLTNLNRCVLFDMPSVGLPKATTAARALEFGGAGSLTWDPHNGLAQEHPRRQQPLDLLLSAVDTNRSRLALQRLIPMSILGASTYNLRASLMRAGPPRSRACLVCHNPLEPEISDQKVRERYLAADAETRARLAESLAISVAELDTWARTARCGELDNRALPFLGEALDPKPLQFSVGYLSVLAGVLLAAEAVKDRIASDGSLNDDLNYVGIQTVSPWSPRNSVTRYLPQGDCIFCGTGGSTTRLNLWEARYSHR
ncbi:hypothetical protein J2790_000106 [Paenarthrobacter nicotinovorans]|uniref:ThiF family adenylyltransferase n=1 Tax=Micrococcaceae TaxID=1268 RepID=UPI000876BEC7|nr:MULTISPECIES: ThiF family adenylyltransferase [Micrococcaceae]MDR6434985.1 hypothetical protein [Paenarthrobacter nicotinovorans]SCZ59169.1 ThiF family protein [Arthrobacter sp. UNCCL28]